MNALAKVGTPRCGVRTENEIRAMRDIVFEHRSSDSNWNACRDNWLRPDSTAWLIKQMVKIAAQVGVPIDLGQSSSDTDPAEPASLPFEHRN